LGPKVQCLNEKRYQVTEGVFIKRRKTATEKRSRGCPRSVIRCITSGKGAADRGVKKPSISEMTINSHEADDYKKGDHQGGGEGNISGKGLSVKK